jgi:GNAT superfamily N-acetyltransferase
MTIREVTEADWTRVGELGAVQVRAHYAFDSARFFAPDTLPADVYTSHVRDELAGGQATVLVADVDGRIAGCVFVAIEPESWKELRYEAGVVHDLVVDEAHRRAGIGRALLQHAIDWFAARGVRRVMLGTATRNDRAQRLFRSVGFRPTMIEMTLDYSS